ncbi:hypothetical protein PHO31112_02331 [Pandoraea horticolens]|uniref:Uncharacterized protein n=1 Tax=Pandoraea horticolens TaxID=2508298 RepID=A0A5E4V0J9_9BURK|nr:hypothetical protein PHO31112_02331 [Pandoraea horticolens]
MDVSTLSPFCPVCGRHQKRVDCIVKHVLLGADYVQLSKIHLLKEKLGLDRFRCRRCCAGGECCVAAVNFSNHREIFLMKLVATDYCRITLLNSVKNSGSNPPS